VEVAVISAHCCVAKEEPYMRTVLIAVPRLASDFQPEVKTK